MLLGTPIRSQICSLAVSLAGQEESMVGPFRSKAIIKHNH